MAKVTNKEVVTDAGDKAVDKVENTKSERTRVDPEKIVKKGVVRFANLTGSPITLVSHTIPANGHKDFLKSIGNAMVKVPLVENLIRLKKLEVYNGS